MVFLPGKLNTIADFLSRSPIVSVHMEEDIHPQDTVLKIEHSGLRKAE